MVTVRPSIFSMPSDCSRERLRGHQFAHGADLRSQFLIADGQAVTSQPVGGGLAFLLGQTQQETQRAGAVPS